MNQKKISTNIVFSIIVQITNFIAPLITAPYVARVLSAELIGQYSYTLANSSYFVLFENLGFTLYGTIKVASIRDKKEELKNVFWEISILRVALMFISMIIYSLLFILINNNLKTLYIIMLINIIANGLDITWFLNGLEEYKFIAIRSVFVKVVNVIAILLFVNSQNDLLLYAFIMQFSVLLGYLAVYPSVIKYIKKPIFSTLKLKRHIVPSLVYFVPGLISTIFSSTDKSILGIYSNQYEVGVYEQANKVCQLCMGMISAVSNVILPRVTYLFYNSGDKKEADNLMKMSIRGALFACIPISFGIVAVSKYFVPFFFGEGYEKSIILLNILSFNVLFVSLSNFVGQQCLIARGQQRKYNFSISIAAILNVVINISVVHIWDSIGISVASVLASMIGFLMILIFSKNCISIGDILSEAKNYILSGIIMFFAICWINISGNVVISFTVQMILAVFVYFICLLILRDGMIYLLIKKVRGKNK